MASKYFDELMRLIVGLCLERIGVVKQLLDTLDAITENERRFAVLYSMLSPDEQALVKQCVNIVSDATKKLNPPAETLDEITSEAITGDEGSEEVEYVPEVGGITVSDVHRNEQVNIVALSRGLQTILCVNPNKMTHRKYYALWPMAGDSIQFELSPEGEEFQWQIRSEMGKRLDRFPRTYAAKVYAYSKLRNNTIEFWEEMRSEGLFKYWDPEKGPYTFIKNAKNPEVVMLRVYEVDCDLNPHIGANTGFRNLPSWKGGELTCQGTPVLTDQEMEEQRANFDQILQKHGIPPSTQTAKIRNRVIERLDEITNEGLRESLRVEMGG